LFLQACKLKLGDAQGALADCEYAMQSGVENVKALFRQGQAQMALNDLDGALESLTNASQLEPNDGKQMLTSKTSMP
jgi:peptidyl-prolyl isomerase D